MKKRSILILLVLVLAAVPLTKSKEARISAFVTDHREELEVIALDCLLGNGHPDRYKQARIDGAFGSMVQFTRYSAGLVPASRYYGFYYSREDAPGTFQGIDMPLEQTGAQEWTWTDGTDNGGITKRITDCWFYYEAWF